MIKITIEETKVSVDDQDKIAIDPAYSVTKFLGSGGFGDVYKAIHLQLGREVAIKLLKVDNLTTARKIREFTREAKILSGLNQQNISQIYHCGTSGTGRPFIAMEFASGDSLRELLLQNYSFSTSQIIEIMLQVCAGLSYAHKRDIIHRDLKPDNIMVTDIQDNLKVKILDFGLAKVLAPASVRNTNATVTGTVFGSPLYMSPEQCLDAKHVDQRTDLYALGCVAYELYSGCAPYVADTTVAVLHQHVNAAIPQIDLTESPTTFEQGLRIVISNCMQKDPIDRYASADEVTAALLPLRSTGELPLPTAKKQSRTTYGRNVPLPVILSAVALVGIPALVFTSQNPIGKYREQSLLQQRQNQIQSLLRLRSNEKLPSDRVRTAVATLKDWMTTDDFNLCDKTVNSRKLAMQNQVDCIAVLHFLAASVAETDRESLHDMRTMEAKVFNNLCNHEKIPADTISNSAVLRSYFVEVASPREYMQLLTRLMSATLIGTDRNCDDAYRALGFEAADFIATNPQIFPESNFAQVARLLEKAASKMKGATESSNRTKSSKSEIENFAVKLKQLPAFIEFSSLRNDTFDLALAWASSLGRYSQSADAAKLLLGLRNLSLEPSADSSWFRKTDQELGEQLSKARQTTSTSYFDELENFLKAGAAHAAADRRQVGYSNALAELYLYQNRPIDGLRCLADSDSKALQAGAGTIAHRVRIYSQLAKHYDRSGTEADYRHCLNFCLQGEVVDAVLTDSPLSVVPDLNACYSLSRFKLEPVMAHKVFLARSAIALPQRSIEAIQLAKLYAVDFADGRASFQRLFDVLRTRVNAVSPAEDKLSLECLNLAKSSKDLAGYVGGRSLPVSLFELVFQIAVALERRGDYSAAENLLLALRNCRVNESADKERARRWVDWELVQINIHHAFACPHVGPDLDLGKSGKYLAKAEDVVRKGLETHPLDNEIYGYYIDNLAGLTSMQGKLDECFDCLQRSSNRVTNNTSLELSGRLGILAELAWQFEKEGRKKNALECVDLALAIPLKHVDLSTVKQKTMAKLEAQLNEKYAQQKSSSGKALTRRWLELLSARKKQ